MHVPYIAYNAEVTIVCAAMIGAGLGFLWYNAAPADVFMGDVGALSLGGYAWYHCCDDSPRVGVCDHGRYLCG